MKVTVVIPAYNAEALVESAIQSVLDQTHADFDLIVINDGSKDNTQAVLQQIAATDSRIQVINQPNQGIAGTLNRALEEAQTEWVMIMHADDLMLPNRLERQIAFIQANPTLKIASCLAYYISDTGKQLGKTSSDLLTPEKFNWYIQNNESIGLLHPGVALHRKTVLSLGGYRQPYWPAEDIDLWNRLAEHGHLILVQDEILMKYRIHTGSASTSRFMLSRMKYEWGRASMIARRNGHSEPTWEAFQANWKAAPIFQRLHRYRKINAKAYYHEAGHDCLRGDYWHGIPKLLWAGLLQPTYVLPRLKAQVLKT